MQRRVFTIVSVRTWAQLVNDWIQTIPDFKVVGSTDDCTSAVAELERSDPPVEIVVIDVGTQLALQTAADLIRSDPARRLIAVALEDDPRQVIAWVTAGAVGLVGRTASLDELMRTLTEVADGQAHCSDSINSALLRGIASNGSRSKRKTTPLTEREHEVADLVAKGCTNKEIATQLQIAPGTVKSHVHNVIRKLGVARRAHVSSVLPHYGLVPRLVARNPR
jgi:DNA-binding NarL/FixJ family response regulator